MIPQAHITAWRAAAPWIDDAQVEQDLVLSRAVVELFSEPALAGQIALRGGTSLNKLFIRPPRRYSEDIDLVQAVAGPIGPIYDAIRNQLDGWLGHPKRARGPGSARLVYQFESEIPPIRPLRLKIEINTREHFSLLGAHTRLLAIDNPWFAAEAEIATYELNELLGTKLRALYQRRKGRDLFDLWLCLDEGLIDVDRMVGCCVEYMQREGHPASRGAFERNLDEKANDAAFMGDIVPLLAGDVEYDAKLALQRVRDEIITRLPD